ncbi:helix-turn-helix domain-containing protein [Flavitalea flava]
MAVVFDFEAGKKFHFLSAFTKRFNSRGTKDQVFLPEMLGEGYIREIYPDNGLSLCIHRYTLRQEFILRRHESGETDMLTIKFDGRRMPGKESFFTKGRGYEAEFGTCNFFTEVKIPPGEEINFLVILITRQSLLDLLQLGEEGAVMENTIRENPSFILHEAMTREMEQTLKQLSQIDETTKLSALLYKTRALELIYFLFARLFSRKEGASFSVNQEDVNKIYQVRAIMLADLSVPPQLPDLARNIGMSSTKMKQLFRQIFGDSIYNYFQVERMKVAAQLLREFSVSQVGYRIGFSNLSHFTRLFEKHHRMKPKRFKDTLEETSSKITAA